MAALGQRFDFVHNKDFREYNDQELELRDLTVYKKATKDSDNKEEFEYIGFWYIH